MLARGPSHGPISSIWARASATVRKPRGLPDRAAASSSAMPDRMRRSGQRGGVGEHLLERARSPLPGHEHAGLVGDRGHREDHVGAAGHFGLAQLQSNHERRRRDGRPSGGRVGGVVRVDTADHQAAEVTGDQGGDDRVAVAARGLGQVVDAPGGGGIDARRGLGHGTATGQQGRQAAGLDRTAVTRPAGHPSQPGSGLLRQRRRGRQGTWHGRQPLADQDHGGLVDAVVGVSEQSVQRCRLGAGSGRHQACRCSLARPRVVNGASASTRVPTGAHGLAQPQEDRTGLVLGLEAREHHRRGTLEVGVGDRAARRDRSAPRGRPGTRPPPQSGGGPGSRCRWCRARPGRTCCRRRRPRRSPDRR